MREATLSPQAQENHAQQGSLEHERLEGHCNKSTYTGNRYYWLSLGTFEQSNFKT